MQMMSMISGVTSRAKKYCRIYKHSKENSPVIFTMRCNDHFGVERRGKNGELAGISMHGSYSVTLFEVLLIVGIASAAALIMRLAGMMRFSFKYKKRH